MNEQTNWWVNDDTYRWAIMMKWWYVQWYFDGIYNVMIMIYIYIYNKDTMKLWWYLQMRIYLQNTKHWWYIQWGIKNFLGDKMKKKDDDDYLCTLNRIFKLLSPLPPLVAKNSYWWVFLWCWKTSRLKKVLLQSGHTNPTPKCTFWTGVQIAAHEVDGPSLQPSTQHW